MIEFFNDVTPEFIIGFTDITNDFNGLSADTKSDGVFKFIPESTVLHHTLKPKF